MVTKQNNLTLEILSLIVSTSIFVDPFYLFAKVQMYYFTFLKYIFPDYTYSILSFHLGSTPGSRRFSYHTHRPSFPWAAKLQRSCSAFYPEQRNYPYHVSVSSFFFSETRSLQKLIRSYHYLHLPFPEVNISSLFFIFINFEIDFSVERNFNLSQIKKIWAKLQIRWEISEKGEIGW